MTRVNSYWAHIYVKTLAEQAPISYPKLMLPAKANSHNLSTKSYNTTRLQGTHYEQTHNPL